MRQKNILAQAEPEVPEGAAVISVGDEDSAFTNLATSLAEIRKLKGVFGYILRNNKAAIVDIEEQEKISAFALLSTHIRESSFEIGKPFNLSDVESVLVEGKNAKVLCMSLGENMLDVFMEKSASDVLVTKRILP